MQIACLKTKLIYFSLTYTYFSFTFFRILGKTVMEYNLILKKECTVLVIISSNLPIASRSMIKASTNNWRNSGSGTALRTLSTSSANFISPLVICKSKWSLNSKKTPTKKLKIMYSVSFYKSKWSKKRPTTIDEIWVRGQQTCKTCDINNWSQKLQIMKSSNILRNGTHTVGLYK